MPAPVLPNDTALMSLITAQVGDLNGIVAANIGVIWLTYGQYAANPLLRVLWCKREALEMLAGAVWQQVNATEAGNYSLALSDRHKAILAAMAEVDKQIVLRQHAGNVPMVGQMTTTEPVPPLTTPQPLPSGPPDPASNRYLGYPLSGRGYPPY